jgi:hypothetical protein
LAFDYKVNSAADGSNLLVKIDSGWPNASDTTVPVAPLGEWRSFSIGVEELRASGNSLAGGSANIELIANMFVIESNGAIDVSFDNVRLEVPAD